MVATNPLPFEGSVSNTAICALYRSKAESNPVKLLTNKPVATITSTRKARTVLAKTDRNLLTPAGVRGAQNETKIAP